MDEKLLLKYVPKKYRDCVLDLYKDIDGYWLILKDGYKSTTTDTPTIHEFTIKELKSALPTIIKDV
ncbi:hypothetical protein [Staphylococcus hominis]|uniref:Uncharacterized protein n=1 Tax=Staphylococcus hominis TaxID=1290 RepID=A0A8X8KLA2_STAHO|nr:hypothetical protein [Staphylococcus hominis]MCM5673022.1 hypothetical protein [Staphylococcus hominis]